MSCLVNGEMFGKNLLEVLWRTTDLRKKIFSRRGWKSVNLKLSKYGMNDPIARFSSHDETLTRSSRSLFIIYFTFFSLSSWTSSSSTHASSVEIKEWSSFFRPLLSYLDNINSRSRLKHSRKERMLFARWLLIKREKCSRSASSVSFSNFPLEASANQHEQITRHPTSNHCRRSSSERWRHRRQERCLRWSLSGQRIQTANKNRKQFEWSQMGRKIHFVRPSVRPWV